MCEENENELVQETIVFPDEELLDDEEDDCAFDIDDSLWEADDEDWRDAVIEDDSGKDDEPKPEAQTPEIPEPIESAPVEKTTATLPTWAWILICICAFALGCAITYSCAYNAMIDNLRTIVQEGVTTAFGTLFMLG